MNLKFNTTTDGKSVEIILDGKVIATNGIYTQKDSGQKYFYMPNLYHQDGDFITRHTFIRRPGEMVQAIREGWGDCIEVNNLMVRTEHLVRFFDRDYGEKMRAKSLEGWKDTEFAWVVFLENSIFGDEPLTISGEPLPMGYKRDARCYQIKYYATEQEAQAFIDAIANELNPKIKEYKACKGGDEKDDYYEQYLRTYSGLKELIILVCADTDRSIPLHIGQVIKRKDSDYRKVKIYRPDDDVRHYYLCPGEAYDKVAYYNTNGGIQEETLHLRDSVSKMFINSDEETLFRVNTDKGATGWYYTLQDAVESGRCAELFSLIGEDDSASIETVTLHQQTLFPIIPSTESPIEAFVEEGSKGLFVRANLNPEQIGSRSNRRKIYFPDKSCADKIAAGRVRITKIKDMGKYGFFVGEMIKMEMPDEAVLAEFLLDNHKEKTILKFIKNPYWGSAVKITNWSGFSDYYIKGKDGKVEMEGRLEISDHKEDEVVETIDAYDFLCSGYTGKTIAELCSIVLPLEVDVGARVVTNPKFISEDFDTAVDIGVIKFYRFKNTDFCSIDPDKMCEAASYLQDKLVSVLEKAAEINVRALARARK